jgi:uncharacterized membrane protein required for colicin V production
MPATVCRMMLVAMVMPPVVADARFNYFDIFVVVWLIIGFFRGRKRGMSQELLPLLQWIGIVVLGGRFYARLSPIIQQNTKFGVLWSNVTAYLLIVLGVHLIYRWFKQMFAEKLVEKDPFGRGEFYLGMMSGVARFGCMLLVAMALMHSRVSTAAELAQMEKFQAAWFSDIRFPTYGEFQQDALIKSFSGKLVESHLQPILIASVASGAGMPQPSQKPDTIAQKSTKEIDDILSSGRK